MTKKYHFTVEQALSLLILRDEDLIKITKQYSLCSPVSEYKLLVLPVGDIRQDKDLLDMIVSKLRPPRLPHDAFEYEFILEA